MLIFASFYPTNPRANPWKYWELAGLKIYVFLGSAILITLISSKKLGVYRIMGNTVCTKWRKLNISFPLRTTQSCVHAKIKITKRNFVRARKRRKLLRRKYLVKDDVSQTESYKRSFQGKEKLKLVKMSLTNTILLTSFLLLITSNVMITIGHPMAIGKSHPMLDKLIGNQHQNNKNDDL